MKKYLLFLLVITSCTAFAQRIDTLTVMSYNIHHGNTPAKAGVIELDSIANVIAKQQPELVALQEVDVNVPRSGNVNQAAYLANKLGMHYYFSKAIDLKGGAYGVAVLSKFKILDQASYTYARVEGNSREDRVLAVITVRLKSGKKIKFSSTHLDHVKDETLRLQQVSEVVKLVEKEKIPFIVAGDLNAKPNSETIQSLRSAFTTSCNACGFTFPVGEPNTTIDYIAFKHNEKITVLHHEVVQEHKASDHLPIVSKLLIR